MTTQTVTKGVEAQVTFSSLERRRQLLDQWSELSNSRQATATQHAYFLVARGLLSKQAKSIEEIATELREAFTPVTNTVKLSNGRTAYDTLARTLANILVYKQVPLAVSEEIQDNAIIVMREILADLRD